MVKRKILGLALSGIAVTGTLMGAVSCGGGKKQHLIVWSQKTQIKNLGMKFADWFGKNQLSGNKYIKDARFIAKNGDAYETNLSSSLGTSTFPDQFAITPAVWFKNLEDKDAILKFHDPKYNESGVAGDTSAVTYNASLAGDKVNEIIKSLEVHNRSSSMAVDKDKNIVGFPTFSEAIGTIYNKSIFKKLGIEKVVVGQAGQGKADTIYNADKITIDETHKTLYTDDLSPKNYEFLKEYIASNKGKVDGLTNAAGIVTSGTESWAFTSKIAGSQVISATIEAMGLKNEGIVLPGTIVKEGDKRATIDNVGKLFAEDKNGIFKETFKSGLDSYVGKNVEYFSDNSTMLSNFKAGHIALMPQGSWEQNLLLKDGGQKKIGFLPLAIKGHVGKIGIGISGYNLITNQKIKHRSGKEAYAFQSQSANFIWQFYMGKKGKDLLANKAKLLNPIETDPNYITDGPLFSSVNEYMSAKDKTLPWGMAFSQPGNGVGGFERNNPTYTDAIDKWAKNQTPENFNDLWKIVKDMWIKSNKQ